MLMPRAIDVIDVLAYTTVLALFVEFAPSILSESFSVSLLTAVVLKIVLELAVLAKKAVLGRVGAATTRPGKILAALGVPLVAVGSKFLILWATDVVFGDAVSLGGFLPMTLLVVALMATRALVRRAVRPSDAASQGPTLA